jgi:hypothetical protein
MTCRIAIFCFCFLATPLAHPEIEMVAAPTDSGVSYHWWPKVTAPDGWHHDQNASVYYSLNALAPDGAAFDESQTVMYAKAVYKVREPDAKSLQMFIENDRKAIRAGAAGVEIQEVAPLTTADGKRLRSFTFFPTKEGNWERVTYGEEGGFYLIFTVSARSLEGYHAASAAYRLLIERYAEKSAPPAASDDKLENR